ncbi:ATP-binding protein [Carbonactinospora thermoautotrophica]|nr:ATP-binding protein [Carbonactinospora thermoautotrophica]
MADRPDRPMGVLAERWVWATLADWRLLEFASDVALCVVELVDNVQAHATQVVADARGRPGLRTAEVVLWCRPGMFLRVETRDRDPRLPVLGPPLPDPAALGCDPTALARLGERGRGLRIVEKTAHGLAWRRLPTGGKTVWCSWRLNARDRAGSEGRE